MGSLQDALLKSGLTSEDELEQARKKNSRKPSNRNKPGKTSTASGKSGSRGRTGKPGPRPHQAGQDRSKQKKSDLERAWIARRNAERAEKERIKQARVADQEARRKRNLKLDAIVEGKSLNHDEADTPRYFEHLGRIRRVLCTPEQRDQLNQGLLGLVNLRGRYLIVAPEVLEAYQAIASDLVPDLSAAEPDHPTESDDYPPVPDDLVW